MAEDPKSDMSRYYYRPGTTEPELRPEFANQPDPAKEQPSDANSAKVDEYGDGVRVNDKGEKVVEFGTANQKNAET